MIAESPRHWMAGWKGALLAFLLPLLAIAYFLGVFASARVELREAGPYRYAYESMKGPYYRIDDSLQELNRELTLRHIPHGGPIGIFYDDPRKVPEKQRRARAGYLLAADVKLPKDIPEAFVPKRRIVQVQVNAHPALAPIKLYRALDLYLQGQGVAMRWPTLERYGPARVVTLEMALP